MLDFTEKDSVKSEITVKFVEKQFIPTKENSRAPTYKPKLLELLGQINNRTVRDIYRELIKTLKYNPPNYLREVNNKSKNKWSEDDFISNFTWKSINLIDDTPIEK
ncbi:14272_t:CDS:2 [Dentiscutata heterogama]|uniref:14272_t:CDS:1 n=1 Tax=Dentiscutata heterogama TaxID=1316150 RepID=A0ACA9MBY3_9GLOM|nr:14272_t:CDS:2 [Dentiscutata heterogama]